MDIKDNDLFQLSFNEVRIKKYIHLQSNHLYTAISKTLARLEAMLEIN